jgi:hypothetical protein
MAAPSIMLHATLRPIMAPAPASKSEPSKAKVYEMAGTPLMLRKGMSISAGRLNLGAMMDMASLIHAIAIPAPPA